MNEGANGARDIKGHAMTRPMLVSAAAHALAASVFLLYGADGGPAARFLPAVEVRLVGEGRGFDGSGSPGMTPGEPGRGARGRPRPPAPAVRPSPPPAAASDAPTAAKAESGPVPTAVPAPTVDPPGADARPAPAGSAGTEVTAGPAMAAFDARHGPFSAGIAAGGSPGEGEPAAAGGVALSGAGFPGPGPVARAGSGEAGPVGGPEPGSLREWIQSRIGYPAEARRRGLEGEVLLSVHVATGGVPDRIRVARSSGARLLDDAARNGVFRAAPLPSSPGWVEVTVRFVLR